MLNVNLTAKIKIERFVFMKNCNDFIFTLASLKLNRVAHLGFIIPISMVLADENRFSKSPSIRSMQLVTAARSVELLL